MVENQKFKDPQFVAKPTKDGKSWSVFCAEGYRRPIEIPDFSSEKAAQYWIDTVSKAWLEKRNAGPNA
jgi:hypothetical protein